MSHLPRPYPGGLSVPGGWSLPALASHQWPHPLRAALAAGPSAGPSPETLAVAVVLFVAIAAYALLAGADFGGGVWDLLAGGARRGAAARAAIDRSVTPVWEANHVWLIFVLVLVWTGFPAAFAAIMTALFIPMSASLLGIVLRGVGFAFRHQAHTLPMQRLTGGLFAVSSLITPFLLGTAVGAIATGQVRAGGATGAGSLVGAGRSGTEVGAWTTPTALLTGGLFVAACGYVGAIFLTVDARRRGETAMVDYFRLRAAAAGLVTGALAGATFGMLAASSPYVFGRLTGTALPSVAISVAAGTAALILLLLRETRGLRVVAAVAVAAVVAGWGWAQYPWLLPTTLSLPAGSAPTSSLLAVLAAAGLGALLVAPGFALLYYLQQRGVLDESETAETLRQAVAAAGWPAVGPRSEGQQSPGRLRAGDGPPAGAHRVQRLIVAAMLAVIGAGIVRRALGRHPARRPRADRRAQGPRSHSSR